MKFTKMHGAGNDYIYIDGISQPFDPDPEFIRKMSDRHFGIGSDGVIVLENSDLYDFKMSMYNADGSQGKMCGNGIRCLAKFAYDHHFTDQLQICFETLSGLRVVHLMRENDQIIGGTVDMGIPSLKVKDLPMQVVQETFVNDCLTVGAYSFRATAVSMGNPHIVLIMDEIPEDLTAIGEAFNDNELFPEGVNVEFIKVINRTQIKMRVYERGSGETLACGTGACAASYACILLDLVDHLVKVELPGGQLTVGLQDNHIWLSGTACTVFEGDYVDE